jgi:hypothetical protein
LLGDAGASVNCALRPVGFGQHAYVAAPLVPPSWREFGALEEGCSGWSDDDA